MSEGFAVETVYAMHRRCEGCPTLIAAQMRQEFAERELDEATRYVTGCEAEQNGLAANTESLHASFVVERAEAIVFDGESVDRVVAKQAGLSETLVRLTEVADERTAEGVQRLNRTAAAVTAAQDRAGDIESGCGGEGPRDRKLLFGLGVRACRTDVELSWFERYTPYRR